MSSNELKLELDAFQGPFDLLLHLIKQMKVDINDIPMSEITSQYLAYLHSMKEFQLDIAGLFGNGGDFIRNKKSPLVAYRARTRS